MAACGKRAFGADLRGARVAVVLTLLMTGCGQSPPPTEPIAPPPAPAPAKTVSAEALLHQPFAEATITDPPPADQRLPDVTMTGKSVGKLFLEVTRIWDSIRFTTPSGKPLAYRAVLDTELGAIEITLRPDWAPNHVRNFVALAQVGYYDGLVFQRTIHEESSERPDARLDLIEAGCPLGTGDHGHGSIGYWLKPEFNKDIRHEEGTVGASRAEDPNSAACKFYITLCRAPVMDGEFTVFGRVSKGLDVARKIFSQPVRNDPEYPEGDRPEKPIVIRKVTIHAQEVEQWAGP
ncbi:MAG: peptidylprolyl isomerase [Gemmataceae bacterium]|nr:peptidylprolyl isomerase [Gemmataceae bacterium]MDW8266627.1 peptidylprolyl isomerase [Gemmataceae bacterium]